MREPPDNQLLVPRLPPSLWPKSGPLQRSRELTTLYVERYTGPRLNQSPYYHPFWEMSTVVRGQGNQR